MTKITSITKELKHYNIKKIRISNGDRIFNEHDGRAINLDGYNGISANQLIINLLKIIQE